MITQKRFSDGNLSISRVVVFIALIMLMFVLQHPVVLIAGSLICAGYAIYSYWPIGVKNGQLILFFTCLTLFLPGFIKPEHGFSPIFYAFSTVSVFFAAKAISNYSNYVFLAAFRIIFIFSILAIALILYAYWGHPEPFGEVIEGSSTNGIPAYLIVLQIGLSLCHFLVRGQLPLLSPILTGSVAFFGNGRGSLVVAGIIISVSFIFNLALNNKQSRARKAIFVFIFCLIVLILTQHGAELLDLLTSYTKLSVGLEDSNRLNILNQYINKLNPWTVFVGAEYHGTVIEYKHNGNPHISYIRTHSFFGLPLTLLAIASPLLVLFYKKPFKLRLVFFTFISLAAIRAGSEPIFFPTLLDFFYFLYFFIYIKQIGVNNYQQ